MVDNAFANAYSAISSVNWTRVGRVAVSVVTNYAPEPIADMAAAFAPPQRIKFRDRYTPQERKNISDEIHRKRPGVVPIILEKARGSAMCDLKTSRFTVPASMSISSFTASLRKQLAANSEEPASTMIITVTDTGRIFGPNSVSVGDFYVVNGSADGFMYLTYREENSFGACANFGERKERDNNHCAN